jgi:hypothetical protein
MLILNNTNFTESFFQKNFKYNILLYLNWEVEIIKMSKEVLKYPFNGKINENEKFLSDTICEKTLVIIDTISRILYIGKIKISRTTVILIFVLATVFSRVDSNESVSFYLVPHQEISDISSNDMDEIILVQRGVDGFPLNNNPRRGNPLGRPRMRGPGINVDSLRNIQGLGNIPEAPKVRQGSDTGLNA